MPETRRRPGPVPRISREAVLDVARDLPPGTMTLTAISDRLGVSGPALYRYFPDRSAILEALAHEAREKIVPPDPSLPWDEWVVRAARLERSLWQTHLDLYQAANYRAIAHPSLELLRVGLDVMTSAGFTIADAFCSLATIAEMAHAIGREESRTEKLLDIEDFPDLAESLSASDVPMSADEVFERSIAIVIDGLRQRLP